VEVEIKKGSIQTPEDDETVDCSEPTGSEVHVGAVE
jgi:hypothetical protein